MITEFKNILQTTILKKKAHCYAIIDGIYRNRQWCAEKQINNGCPKRVLWREMKPYSLIMEACSLKKLLNKALLVSLFA